MYSLNFCSQCHQLVPAGHFYQDFGLCHNCGQPAYNEYERKRSHAITLVRKALQSGYLTRPESCEVCGFSPFPLARTKIQAHHWNGYDHPLDVWFICKSCNAILQGKKFHTGQVTKEQAREYVWIRRSSKVFCRFDAREQPRWVNLVKKRFATVRIIAPNTNSNQ